MTLIHWASDIDLKELVILLQCLNNSNAREDIIDLNVGKAQFGIGVKERT